MYVKCLVIVTFQCQFTPSQFCKMDEADIGLKRADTVLQHEMCSQPVVDLGTHEIYGHEV